MLQARKNAGFTLIELSIVLTIIGILISAAVASYSIYYQKKMIVTTKDNITAAINAVSAFKSANGYFPCPATGTDPAATATDCSASPPSDITRVASQDGRHFIRIGVVPLSARNKSGDMVQLMTSDQLIDGYRNRLAYAVVETMATNTADFNAAGNGSIVIVNSNDTSAPPINESAQYLIFSHGSDGKGAYTAAGILRDTCNTNAVDGENCDGDAVFADNALGPRSFTGDDTNYDDFIGGPALASSSAKGGINGWVTYFSASSDTSPGTSGLKNMWGEVTAKCATGAFKAICKITCTNGVPRLMMNESDTNNYIGTGTGVQSDTGHHSSSSSQSVWACTDGGAGSHTVLINGGALLIGDDGNFIASEGMSMLPTLNCSHPSMKKTCDKYKELYSSL